MSGLKSIARNSAHLTIAKLLTFIGRGVYVTVVARALGPELYALLAYSQAWYITFLPLALFGLSGVLGRELSRDPEKKQQTVESAFAISLLANGTAATLCIGIAWLTTDSRELTILIMIMSLALAGRAAAVFSQQVFVATEQAQYVLKQEFLFRTLEIGAGIALLLLGGGLIEIASLHAIVWWAQDTSAVNPFP